MRKSKHLILVAALAAIAPFVATDVFAASMRCGGHIISAGQRHGMGKYEVLKRCGQPTERYGNTWIYEKQGQQRRVLRFGADGMLSDISTSR